MTESFLTPKYPLWTHEESIAFECAQEVLIDLSAICTTRIYDEEAKALPDLELIKALRTKQAELRGKRDNLTIGDQAGISKIRQECGAEVRAWRAQAR